VGVEGARRLGFKIQRIGAELEAKKNESHWLQDKSDGIKKLHESKQLARA
jgi:hypothetical protein